MKRSYPFFILLFCSIISFGQNISITFTGTGAATQIDSIFATNLTTGQSVTFPGNETLILSANSGNQPVSFFSDQGMVFPNPFTGTALLIATVDEVQPVIIRIQNIVGQVVVQKNELFNAGENALKLSLSSRGIYAVSLTTNMGTHSCKIVCSETSGGDNRIDYLGTGSDYFSKLRHPEFKSLQSSYSLGYALGEIILYKFYSGIYTPVVTDSPTTSKNIPVEFAACTDLDGMNYSIVKIGDQTWMAENLAYLPRVGPANNESETSAYYYVYDYPDRGISAAKGTANYSIYGVLYNYSAALTACPSGWHLPTGDEWDKLSDYLGSTVGGALKQTGTTLWKTPNEGATNSSGFSARPGGSRYSGGGFYDKNTTAFFWGKADEGAQVIYGRSLTSMNTAVGRVGVPRSFGFSIRCMKN